MAESKIVFSTFIELPEPFNKLGRLKLSTRDGGRHSTAELVDVPEGISKEALARLGNKLVATLVAETEKIEQAKAEATERKRIAREEERQRVEARQKAEAAEQERQIRRQNFLQTKNRKLEVPFDAATMFASGNEAHALKVAVNNPKLTFAGFFETQEYVKGAGHVALMNFAFLDPEKLGARVCPECGHATLHTSVSQSSGIIHRECSHKGCKFFANEQPEPAHSYVRQAMHPLQAR